MSKIASSISAYPAVRTALLERQQDFAGQPGGAVLDGRDIGTVIAPKADAKLFVTASPEVRAERRLNELFARGMQAHFEDVLADIRARDERDSHRAVAPLKPAPDAMMLDTTELVGRPGDRRGGTAGRGEACLARGEGGGLKDRLAVEIAGRRITANEIVPVGLKDRAADARGRRPHHLGIISDVFPIAGLADRGEDTGMKQALFRLPQADHLVGGQGPVERHRQISRAGPGGSRGASGPDDGGWREPGHRMRPKRRGRDPFERGMANCGALAVMGGKDAPGEFAGRSGILRAQCRLRRIIRMQWDRQRRERAPCGRSEQRNYRIQPRLHSPVLRRKWLKPPL